jgi:hypothetical protein
MGDDPELFAAIPPRRGWGRVRKGLEADVTGATDAGITLPAAGVASLRTLADSIDDLDHRLRVNPKPYDRVPLGQLVAQMDDTYSRVFATVAGADDPLARALAEFAASEGRDPAGDRAD